MKFSLAALMLALCTLLCLPAQAAPKDVFGREVPVGTGRPTLVFLSNERTRDVLLNDALELGYELRALEPIMVVHVDLRGVPGMFKGVARREVRKAHRESVATMEKLFRDRGEEPPSELIRRSLFMVPEYKGEPHRAQGLKKDFERPLAEVRSPEGSVVLTGVSPGERERIIEAVRSDSKLTSR